MIDNLSIGFNASARRMLISLLIDEIWLLRYVFLSTDFRGLSLRVEMVPFRLKYL